MKKLTLVIILASFLLSAVVVHAELKTILPQYFPETFKMERTTSRLIAEISKPEEKNYFVRAGCAIVNDLEDSLVMTCPKSVEKEVMKMRNVRREKLLSVMAEKPRQISPEDIKAIKAIKPMDLADNAAIRATDVWLLGYTGKGRIVAILDSGVDKTHPELSSDILGGFNLVKGTVNITDDLGHGTAMAGIITSDGINEPASRGIAPDAKIIMGKVCDFIDVGGFEIYGCPEGAVAAGIDWAMKGLDGVPKSGDEPDAISISLGSDTTWISRNCDQDFLARRVNAAAQKGMLIVVAAGNNPFGVSSPACASRAIAAGGVGCYFLPFSFSFQDCPSWYDTVSSFSGRGYPMRHHGVLAPASLVFTTVPTYDCEFCDSSGYNVFIGTSLSAPDISGLVALMKEKNPKLLPENARRAIFSSAVDVIGFQAENKKFEQGYGRIDALNAIEEV